MLDFKHINKKYPDGNIALEDITFSIEDGEFVFIVGSSGAGKSTIIKLLLNIEKPTTGEVYFNGINVNKLKGKKLAYLRREIGVVFQDFKLLKQKTVYENVAFVLEVANEKKTNIKKKVNDVLDLVGLLDKAKKFPAELSGGEQQRVSIARALINDPLLLIADEPTGNLDSGNAWDTFQLINKVNNWGTTVVVVTHDDEIVDSLQKRVIHLDKGRIIRDAVGGYSHHHNPKEAEEHYKHNQDKFPDFGESKEEFQERKEDELEELMEHNKHGEMHPNHEAYTQQNEPKEEHHTKHKHRSNKNENDGYLKDDDENVDDNE